MCACLLGCMFMCENVPLRVVCSYVRLLKCVRDQIDTSYLSDSKNENLKSVIRTVHSP